MSSLATSIVALSQALLLNWVLGFLASKLRTLPDFPHSKSTGAAGMHSRARLFLWELGILIQVLLSRTKSSLQT